MQRQMLLCSLLLTCSHLVSCLRVYLSCSHHKQFFISVYSLFSKTQRKYPGIQMNQIISSWKLKQKAQEGVRKPSVEGCNVVAKHDILRSIGHLEDFKYNWLEHHCTHFLWSVYHCCVQDSSMRKTTSKLLLSANLLTNLSKPTWFSLITC